MGIIKDDVLHAIKSEIENTPHRIIYTTEIADKYSISIKDLCNQFKYKFGVSVKEYAGIVKLNYLKDLILKEDENYRMRSHDYAIMLGYADDSGIQNLTKKNGEGRTFNEFKSAINSCCREYKKKSCEEICEEIIQ
ncbi:hypothetical protein ACFL6G_06590 [candidate division KSB1 bacterium]